MTRFVLGSASPRRTELLSQLGVVHTVLAADIDETPAPHELPLTYVQRMASSKARRVADYPDAADCWVLTADTIVVSSAQPAAQNGSVGRAMAGGAILGKPVDQADGLAMLARLSGRTHQVITAVCLRRGTCRAAVWVNTWVTFRSVSVQEAREYWNSGEAQDKAGGYGIQGLAGAFVSKIDGSYSNVIGLPLTETRTLLRALGALSD